MQNEATGDAEMDRALDAARRRARGRAVETCALPACDKGTFEARLDQVLDDVRRMLLAKNKAYGNSALDPVRVFSRADTAEQLRVRIDDKLSRIMRGAAAGEDVVDDLIGYLLLLKIAERKA